MKRIIILRHCEEPKQKKIAHIASEIGMTNQGAVRTFMMPKLVHKLINDDAYQLHTYTHTVDNEPTSRSFYTCQFLDKTNIVLYHKSADFHELVENIKASKAKTIIVVWEHLQIPKIIKLLIGKRINYEKTCKKIWKRMPKKTSEKISLLNVTYCAESMIKKNKQVRDYYISFEDDLEYSLVWDIAFDETGSMLIKKSLSVYPGFLIKKGKKWKVLNYL